MKVSKIEEYLEVPNSRISLGPEQEEAVAQALVQIKSHTVKVNDQHAAKYIWCLETILTIQKHYVTAFEQLKGGEYYQGWCTLERAEIAILSLEKHFDISSHNDRFKINFIKSHIERFQSIFPYRAFFSPGILKLKWKCSICNEILSLRKHCGHIIGEIYDGEICCREITEAKILEISVVPNPVQKYSVLFLSDQNTGKQIDQYNYSHVKYVINGLENPFDAWTMRWMKIRHPHSRFKDIKRNAPCPCESGEKYKNCCWKEEGVLVRHLEIDFAVSPPPDFPRFEYAY